MVGRATAYYFWPLIWNIEPPCKDDINTLDRYRDVVYQKDLDGLGISFQALREGRFIFDFSNWKPEQDLIDQLDGEPDFRMIDQITLKRVSVLNAHLCCLYTSICTQQECKYHLHKFFITPADIISMSGIQNASMIFGSSPMPSFVFQGYPIFPLQDLRVVNFKEDPRKVVIEKATLDSSLELLAEILLHSDIQILPLVDLYLLSCRSYEDHNYSLCLTTSWTAIEALLRNLWDKYVQDNRERIVSGEIISFINSERKEKLIKGRDFTASIISEILSILEIIPLALYKNISIARQARNAWLHNLVPIKMDDAQVAINVVEEMLSLVMGVKLKVPLGLSVHI